MPAAKALSKAEQSIALLPAQLGASGDPNYWVPCLQTAHTGVQQQQVTACSGCMFPLVHALRRTTHSPPSFLGLGSG